MTVNALYPTVAPSLDLNFVRSGVLDSRVTFTRASTGTSFNSLGTLTTALTNVPRLDYNPSTLAAQGLLIEEQRTNSIRNNTMVGAVAGTPGNVPTNWSFAAGGLTANVIGTGVESGINYVDIQLVGTTASTSAGIRFEPTNQTAAASGQSWSGSFYTRIVSGSITNILETRVNIFGRTAANASNTDNSFSADFKSSLTAANLSQVRRTHSSALADATTSFVSTQLLFGFSSGVAIDITLRIGLPQLEQGAFATSVIPTSTVAVTRSADVASVNTLSPWYNATEGTLYAEYQPGVTAQTLGTVALSDGTLNNRMIIRGMSTLSITTFIGVNGGAAQWNDGFATATATATKSAFAYATNNIAFTRNGATPITDASATIPTVSQLVLGADGDQSNKFNGYLRRVTYFPVRLSNANLQAITT